MNAITALYRQMGPTFDAADEVAAEAYGWSMVEEADAAIARQLARSIDYCDACYHAAHLASCYAIVLDNFRVAAYTTPAERAGMRLQARWWRDVAREINDREAA